MSDAVPAVLGLDLSITATGVADWVDDPWTVRTKSEGDARLPEIRDALADPIASADLVVIEDLPVNAKAAGITGMVHGAVRLCCFDHAVTYVTVPPASLKKYATGSGNADKADMRMALYRRLGVDNRDHNQVDALWLRLMALDALGFPVVEMPKANRAALDAVTWPELTGQTPQESQ